MILQMTTKHFIKTLRNKVFHTYSADPIVEDSSDMQTGVITGARGALAQSARAPGDAGPAIPRQLRIEGYEGNIGKICGCDLRANWKE